MSFSKINFHGVLALKRRAIDLFNHNIFMYTSQQSRTQNLSGYSSQATTWTNTLGSTQNATIERASEDIQASALREILTSFRTEITNVLPSLSH